MYTDFFISHSKETKLLLAIPLVQSLSSLGFNVWIDRNGIVVGQHIYHKIEEAIANSTYCIAIIDQEFLSRSWPLEELRLFHLKENEAGRTFIIPIYVDVDKEEVYEKLPWLEGRAFEKFSIKDLNKNNNLELICRIVGRYYIDNISDSYLGNLEYSSLLNHSFPCKETLLSLLDSKEYFSHDLRIAIIEICNICGVVNAIYNALTTCPNKYIDISNNFSNILRSACFDTKSMPTYNMYISSFHSLYIMLEKLILLLDSQ